MFSKRIIKLSIITVLFFASHNSASADITTGLVSHYKLDETTGTIADDSVGTNNGTLTNGPTWTTGKINNGLSFDGVDDYVNTTDTPFDFERTNSFSASAWVKNNSTTGEYPILSKEDIGPTYKGWAFYIRDGKLRVFLMNNWGSPYNRIARDSVIQVGDNAWHHVAFTYNGSSQANGVNIYIDGFLSNGTIVYDNLSASILNNFELRNS